ncbi:Glycosyltransferase involved in cell wall bisynthesis [Paenibacillus sp. UNCCL117]|uniref:glycosyltransferase family 4 protein n=1 Tax=unclassified Paenibacillus TaxID=185978 RepID=UPI000888097F|nr:MULTISPECIES: glycosyltransferase family 4 protein [unclassified Paenibacillus]SDC02938.1 Glycosyltransferase involved in cell wall bisynthesis [Paenibacillus sp. cl123]SFW36961.1 Glycosyltransferase involved in cell wall bisynthesis [Paenibacillus sp. UNCCL117]
MSNVWLGCSAGLGSGGLGGHLDFVYKAALEGGVSPHVYCREAPSADGFTSIPSPSWYRYIKYTPLRWKPSAHVYMGAVQFDKAVAAAMPAAPAVYHSFPAFAEESFLRVRKSGGVNVLEAATTHVDELYASTMQEHRQFRMSGEPFSMPWVSRVLREYELADYITVASRLQWETFADRGIPEKKLLFAPLGVDTKRFSPEEGQPSLRTREKGEPLRIIAVGQVSLLKGFPYLLEAAAALNDPEIEITLFGGVGWRGIRKLVDAYIGRGLTIKLGVGDPLPALRRSHICVHASVSDGFGLAPLEAMAAGLPVIVTEGTGMKDAVRDGENGFVVPKRDAAALAGRLAELKTDDALRIRMGAEARKTALGYDAARMTAAYAALLAPVWNLSKSS